MVKSRPASSDKEPPPILSLAQVPFRHPAMLSYILLYSGSGTFPSSCYAGLYPSILWLRYLSVILLCRAMSFYTLAQVPFRYPSMLGYILLHSGSSTFPLSLYTGLCPSILWLRYLSIILLYRAMSFYTDYVLASIPWLR